jgi:hypothetical protein
MTKKILLVCVLFLALVGVVVFEQIYTENSLNMMFDKISSLQTEIDNKDLAQSKRLVSSLREFWKDREKVICLFVDYRDIEQISKQTSLVISHLDNSDFALAKVESNALFQAVANFSNMVKFDFWNIF